MNWFKSFFSRNVSEPNPQKQDPELERAYDLGQKWAGDMSDAMDLFVSKRFDGLKERYLSVLQDGLNSAKSSTDFSPILCGRVEFQLFRENLDELQIKMVAEIDDHMKEWKEIAAKIEMESAVNELIEHNVKIIADDLLIFATKVLLDNADELKSADDAWRHSNPELAAQQPLDHKGA